MDPTPPNAGDPVEDPAYPGITAVDDHDDVVHPPEDGSWDTDPALAPTQRSVGGVVLEPEDAWAALTAYDEGVRP